MPARSRIRGAHVHGPARNVAHRLDQVLGNLRLQDKPAGSGAQGVRHRRLRRHTGQQDQPRLRQALHDGACGAQAVQHGHHDVEHDHVGAQLLRQPHRLTTVRSHRHHVQPLRLEQQADPLEHDRMIVGDEHAGAEPAAGDGGWLRGSFPTSPNLPVGFGVAKTQRKKPAIAGFSRHEPPLYRSTRTLWSLVSLISTVPTTKVITATTIGYHRP